MRVDTAAKLSSFNITCVWCLSLVTAGCRCSLAATAQFWPQRYPDNSWVLMTCVVLYIAATIAMNIALSGVEGGVIFMSKQKV